MSQNAINFAVEVLAMRDRINELTAENRRLKKRLERLGEGDPPINKESLKSLILSAGVANRMAALYEGRGYTELADHWQALYNSRKTVVMRMLS